MVLCRNCNRFEIVKLSNNSAANDFRGLCLDCIHMKRRENRIISIAKNLSNIGKKK